VSHTTTLADANNAASQASFDDVGSGSSYSSRIPSSASVLQNQDTATVKLLSVMSIPTMVICLSFYVARRMLYKTATLPRRAVKGNDDMNTCSGNIDPRSDPRCDSEDDDSNDDEPLFGG
jgi:hypothetical protein